MFETLPCCLISRPWAARSFSQANRKRAENYTKLVKEPQKGAVRRGGGEKRNWRSEYCNPLKDVEERGGEGRRVAIPRGER